MDSKTPPNKILQDISDCISDLKRESLDGKYPINDDSAILHRFQGKLELILLFGLIEKPGILGPKKSYWNYICACFTSSKKSHDGIHFVKSLVPLKTHLGRGRALIRFCLAQKCLADTLQYCFMNQRISREFYYERSLLVQEKLWSFLVVSLYELNELNFDLSTVYTELDTSWPKFARKLFTSSESLSFLQKDSANVLHSFSSENEHKVTRCSHSKSLSSLDSDISASNLDMSTNVPELSDLHKELPQENMCLQEEVKCLKEEKLKLQTDIQKLQLEFKTLQQQMNLSFKGNCNESEIKKTSSSSFATIEPKDSLNVGIDNVKNTRRCDDDSFTNIPIVKPKIKDGAEGNISECAFQPDDVKINSLQVTDAFDMCDRNSEDLQMKNICLPQNQVYISELLFEFKTVIDDIEDIIQKSEVSLAVPHISRLKRIRGCLEENFVNQFDKSKSRSDFNNFVENCVSCIKTFTTKQEDGVNSLQEKVDLSINQNQNLYSRITALKNLLRSYGFLKLSNEKEIESKSILLPFDINSTVPSTYESFSCDNIAHDPVLKRIIVPLIPVLNSVYLKIHNLNAKMTELQFGLDSSHQLNNNLITRVQDQEIHLKGVTKELEEAQHLVSVIQKKHKKLQSTESILKYDLQEKRKLLTRLRQQLENTREDFNLVRIKNSKSEAEWQDLRKEFVQRHKQTSEESGFVDDKVCEEYEPTFSTSRCDSSFSEKATTECILNNNQSEIVYEDVPMKKSRLELLEEQCQSLYSNLLQGSKKRQDIDKRLETMCNAIEKSNNGFIHSRTLPSDVPAANRPDNINDASVNTSSEDICQNVIFSTDNFNSSPHSSSDVGSLNSECSSSIPGIFNDTNSCDSCCCSSSKTDSCISLSPLKLQIGTIQNLSTMEQDNEDNSLLYSDSTSACKGENALVLSCEYMELSGSNVQSSEVHNLSLSHVDSLLIKKKDLEESLTILEIDNELLADKKRYVDAGEFAKQIEALEEEKRLLLNKIQDLEKKALNISTELDNTKEQLMFSKAAKEHEVAALQFQLNTEALKYERALKGFSEQNKGLESMKEKITDQEELILALEEALTEIRVDRENEKEMQWQELEDIHIAFEAQEQECITLSQDLEKCLSDVEKEKNKNELLQLELEDLKAYSIKDKESMETQLIHLQNDSMALKKKLIKLLKDKDLLWKRNNHLYHIQKVKIDDRWMNDSEVSNCLGCKNNFSFLIRKHHCRLCGRIFCYSCSNNWLLTASSSKKIRACNECFMQHIEMKKDIRRGSDIPHIEDDSGDEHNGDLSFIPMSNGSFTSEVPSSITDSVISLPLTQKQSTPRFASAPDLRCVIRPDVSLSSVLLVQENVLEESNEEMLFSNRNKELVDLNASDISSDECTSMTLEEDIPRINRLKEISIDEIKSFEHGLSRECIIPPGEKADLPIYCQTCPMIIQWDFISNCQDIPITITHTDKGCDSEPILFFQDKHMMQDEMEISLPGYYVFHFDNSFRTAEVKIQYNILLKHTSEVESFQN